jgi:hypothetical protein
MVYGHQRTSPSHTILQQVPHWITVELVCEREGMLWDILWRKLFEDLLDNRYFILKTDHMNLTYINVTFTGKV